MELDFVVTSYLGVVSKIIGEKINKIKFAQLWGIVGREQALRQVFQINGGVDGKYYSPIIQEEKLSVEGHGSVHSIAGGKGSGLQDASDMANDDVSGKRFRSTPAVSEGLEQDLTSDRSAFVLVDRQHLVEMEKMDPSSCFRGIRARFN